ncbi:MAG: hypothetical protein AAF570_24540, partial [Bacteroidota bacterium]
EKADEYLMRMAKFSHLQNLKVLKINRCEFYARSMDELLNSEHPLNLAELYVHDSHLPADTVHGLLKSKKLENLHVLQLSSGLFKAEHVATLIQERAFNRVERLYVHRNPLGHAEICGILEGEICKENGVLGLSKNTLEPGEVTDLEARADKQNITLVFDEKGLRNHRSQDLLL